VPVTYQGEEIGMTDSHILRKNAKDPVAHLYKLPQFIIDRLPLLINRDECRTPMQWDTTANGGFTQAGIESWLPVNQNYRKTNVQKAINDSNSLIHTYKNLLSIRNGYESIKFGNIEIIENKTIPSKILVFKRFIKNEEAIVIINFTNKAHRIKIAGIYSQLIFNTHGGNSDLTKPIELEPYQGLVLFNKKSN